jgi:hypothetical protein
MDVISVGRRIEEKKTNEYRSHTLRYTRKRILKEGFKMSEVINNKVRIDVPLGKTKMWRFDFPAKYLDEVRVGPDYIIIVSTLGIEARYYNENNQKMIEETEIIDYCRVYLPLRNSSALIVEIPSELLREIEATDNRIFIKVGEPMYTIYEENDTTIENEEFEVQEEPALVSESEICKVIEKDNLIIYSECNPNLSVEIFGWEDNNKEMRDDEIVINLSEMFNHDSFLSSRHNGELVRRLEDVIILQNKKRVVLNFENITGVDYDFVYQLVGMFVEAYGVGFIKKNIRVINMGEQVRSMLNDVLSHIH